MKRRDFLNGVALTLPGANAWSTPPEVDRLATRTGLQGQTDAMAAVAHSHLRDAALGDDIWAAEAQFDEESPDLVVVGAGLSGLAGAYWFARHAGRPVRILLLEAAEEVGGHARRNEFVSRSGKWLVGYGGSQSLDTPGLFSPAARQLLHEIGIDLDAFRTQHFDHGWAQRHGVAGSAQFFAREQWGRDCLVPRSAGAAAGAGVQEVGTWPPGGFGTSPLTALAQADLARLRTPALSWSGSTRAQRLERLATLTYAEFLLEHWRVDPEVLKLQHQATLAYFGAPITHVCALDAWAAGLSGFAGLDLGEGVHPLMSPSARQLKAGQDDYIYHFPDGNAGVARALMRALDPQWMPGHGMASLADAPIQRERLDRAGSPRRLRLGATVVGVRHEGSPDQSRFVRLRYRDARGDLREVRCSQVLLACWHRVIAQLARDELPLDQREALNDQVKVPLVYANALLSHWVPWQRAGIGSITCVRGFWREVGLDFPVRMGSLGPPPSPEEPILVHLGKVVVPEDPPRAMSPREMAQEGRKLLLQWDYAHFERETVSVLQRALGPFGFNAERDLEALTVSRWSHGYSYEYMRPFDAFWPDGPLPCERARQGWGRVAIANADSGAFAYAHSAIDQAARAVQELLPEARLPRPSSRPGPDPGLLFSV